MGLMCSRQNLPQYKQTSALSEVYPSISKMNDRQLPPSGQGSDVKWTLRNFAQYSEDLRAEGQMRKLSSSPFPCAGHKWHMTVCLAKGGIKGDSLHLVVDFADAESLEPGVSYFYKLQVEMRFGKNVLRLEQSAQFGLSSPRIAFEDVAPLAQVLSSLGKDGSLVIILKATPTTMDAPNADNVKAFGMSVSAPPAAELEAPEGSSPGLILKPICISPRVINLINFVSKDQCQYLIQMATPHLRPSLVSGHRVSKNRTSHGMFLLPEHLNDPVVKEVEKRIMFACNTLGFPYSTASDKLQIIRYEPGQEFKPHYDNDVGAVTSRAATIIIYLNDVPAGGETAFPKALDMTDSREAELKVKPVMGSAIIFFSRLPNGKEDMRSLHAGLPVLQGVKYIATKWLSIDPPDTAV
eukprot:jgi/Mesvir1/18117/Mv09414-RA.1